MSPLEPCPDCARHVRTSETSCPFCGADIAAAMRAARPRPLPRTRLSRAALLAFGLGVAASGVMSCAEDNDDGAGRGDDSDDDDDGDDEADDGGRARDDGGRVTPVYGAPVQPRDAGSDASHGKLDGGRDPVAEGGSVDVAADASTTSDARVADAATTVDAATDGGADAGRRFDASVVALYGLPPAPPRDQGGVVTPLYGAPVQDPRDRGNVGVPLYGAPVQGPDERS